MKRKNWFFISALCALMSTSFVACDNDDDPIPTPSPTPETSEYTAGFYIINRGKSKSNNSCISYYDLTNKKITGHVFETVNGRKLGDSAQEFFQYGTKIYIPVYNSMIIEVVDAATLKSLKSIEPKDAGGNGAKPRAMTASGDYVYATLYNGYVARIDTTTLEIDKQVKVGLNPDKLSAQGDVLYTANSGGLNSPNYDKTVSVVDLNTFEVKRNVEVIINPTRVITDSEGDAYVISMGNYSKDPATLIPNTLQYFKKGSSEVKEIRTASVVSICNDTIYGVYKQYGATTYDFFTYDAKAEKMISEKFVTDETKINGDPQEIDVDPLTGNVYVSVGGKDVNGDMYIFSREGKLINKFDTDGLYPQGVLFVYKEQASEKE
ncbi:YncE family protein [Parabacteroides chinchillae]|uniref:40-residue YVTN family beta-propeller repeat-containing protein n=1 Tax=Parabacteroides chinchillae TaxID=871327 RepID=A0A8G2F681_9BACT|nr:DUF5074 domain-containing protein [Parabacteroides chinchillae]SEG26601.1 hypothetical protein SAMN05444001_12511 [Parabacteroides chinchillae]